MTLFTVWFADESVYRQPPTVSYATLPGCDCGCALNQSSGYVVASSTLNGLCPPERAWLIVVPRGSLVRLSFVRFGDVRGTVRVHDGNTSLSNLLLRLGPAGSFTPRCCVSSITYPFIRIRFRNPCPHCRSVAPFPTILLQLLEAFVPHSP